jgi:molybdate transport system substrate-binding protein
MKVDAKVGTVLTRRLSAALLICLAATGVRADGVLTFAAASTKDALNEIGERYGESSGRRVTFSFASSADLARQIEHGAPADLFLSADTAWMDYLSERRLLVADSRRDLLSNRLVLIAPEGSELAIEMGPGAPLAAALGDGWFVLADPDIVPAGRYARTALEKLGLWSGIESRLVGAKDVRAALALVERGEAAAGIVYATDAMTSERVRVVDNVPADSHPPILYPMAILSGHDDDDARAFAAYLAGPEAKAVFARFGFLVLPAGGAS